VLLRACLCSLCFLLFVSVFNAAVDLAGDPTYSGER